MKKILLLVVLSFTVVSSCWAWNAEGHRVVAQIAYDGLSAQAKKAIDKLTYPEGEKYLGKSRFLFISTWADRIRYTGDKRFDKWHYIDLPISEGGFKTEPPNSKNGVWAIGECQRVLKNPNAPVEKKLLYLKLLVHIVGDIHQPLHATSRYSWRYPHGDYGGNFVQIRDQHKRKITLHQYWDRGCGLFNAYDQRYKIRAIKTRKVASAIERHFPRVNFGLTRISQPAMTWANEGRHIASTFVYNTRPYATPSGFYTAKGQRICEERLALGGYRLAHILNSIYRDMI